MKGADIFFPGFHLKKEVQVVKLGLSSTSYVSKKNTNHPLPGKPSVPFFKPTVAGFRGKVDGN